MSDSSVTVTEDATRIVLAPTGTEPSTGVFFQPGAKVDARAYAAVLRPLAEDGRLVVIAKQPLSLAFLATGAFASTRPAYPAITRWVVGGHSLGGVVAASDAAAHDEEATAPVVGLLLFASVTRYVFNVPFVWIIEMAQFLMAAYYILGGGYSMQLDAHVRMDVLYERWRPRTRAFMDSLTAFFLVFYLVIMLRGGFASSAYSLKYNQTNYSAWAPPMAPRFPSPSRLGSTSLYDISTCPPTLVRLLNAPKLFKAGFSYMRRYSPTEVKLFRPFRLGKASMLSMVKYPPMAVMFDSPFRFVIFEG